MRGRVQHLVIRFFSGLRPASVSDDDRDWVRGYLHPAEQELWDAYAERDQAHTLAVGRSVERWVAANPDRASTVAPEGSRLLVAAALLHDIGKIEAPLGLLGRVVATLAEAAAASRMGDFADRQDLVGAIARYCDYPERGGALLTAAGSHPLVAAWAGEHHAAAESWSVPVELGQMLVDADDGRLRS